jgi:hypothetical protein
MCVILACETRKPSLELLEKCEIANKHGAGIAWIENNKVRWEKNLTAEQIHQRVITVELPFVIHFRFASAGGINPLLTHPFPITENVGLNLKGTANKVLFHNGHWSKWEDFMFKMVISKNKKIPDGVWSDTRMIAWITYMNGENILNFLDEKTCILSKNGIRIFQYKDWTEDDGIVFSNKLFEYKTVIHSSVSYGRTSYGVGDFYKGQVWDNKNKKWISDIRCEDC